VKDIDTGYMQELPLTVQNSPVAVGRNASSQSMSQSSKFYRTTMINFVFHCQNFLTGDKSAESNLDNTIEPVQMIMASVDQRPNDDHIPDIHVGHEPGDDNISEAQSGNFRRQLIM
jgi:hypothetical protein